MIIEFPSTNEDVGVQIFLGAVRWKTVKFFTPRERQTFKATAAVGFFRQGSAEQLLDCAATTFRLLLLLAILLFTNAIVAVTLRSVQALRV